MRAIFRCIPLIVLILGCDSSNDKETTPVAAELQPVSPPLVSAPPVSTPEPLPVPTPEAPPVVTPEPPPPPPLVEPAPVFAEVFTAVLKPKCLRCHSSDSPAGDISLETREGVLAIKDLVSCGRPEDSLLYQVVEKDEMPLVGPPLEPEEKKLLARWIEGNCL